jgi:transcription elongation factor Elf1
MKQIKYEVFKGVSPFECRIVKYISTKSSKCWNLDTDFDCLIKNDKAERSLHIANEICNVLNISNKTLHFCSNCGSDELAYERLPKLNEPCGIYCQNCGTFLQQIL